MEKTAPPALEIEGRLLTEGQARAAWQALARAIEPLARERARQQTETRAVTA